VKSHLKSQRNEFPHFTNKISSSLNIYHIGNEHLRSCKWTNEVGYFNWYFNQSFINLKDI